MTRKGASGGRYSDPPSAQPPREYTIHICTTCPPTPITNTPSEPLLVEMDKRKEKKKKNRKPTQSGRRGTG